MSSFPLYTVSKHTAESSIAPAYYRTTPPPHWLQVPSPTSASQPLDISKRKFKSPWTSNAAGGLLGYLWARLFYWDEVPLPPKIASSPGDSVLPPVHAPTWTAADSTGTESTGQGVVFTWLGHATCHLQIPIGPGKSMTILCDPVLSRRPSPVHWLGPERYTDAPVTVEEIATATTQKGKSAWPDLLVLSHNHYDHMDYTTLSKLLHPKVDGVKRPHVFCTLGNKQWFQTHFGLADHEITESDWWQQNTVSTATQPLLQITCVPAQHFSGRSMTDRDSTLWAGWVFRAISSSPGANVYFAGDTGYRTVPKGMPREQEDTLPAAPFFKEIGEVLGPFDLSLIPIGAYLPRYFMSTIHLAPQDAVLVHQDVKSKKSYGIYWGSFRLSPEDVNEPPKLLMEEAKRQKLDAGSIEVVEIGQSVFVPVQVSTRNIGSEEESKPGTTHDERLPESKLGTKEHWDSVYAREVANFYDIGEEGEVWFGEDAVMRMIRFLEQFFQTETRFSSGGNAPTVLDLGTGNGHLLFEMLESSADLDEVLAAERMLGVDYSETSIELARAIGAKRGADCEKVMFRAADLLDPAQVAALNHVPTEQLDATEEQWDLVCDKGTMDAIALSSQPVRGEMPIDAYSRAVAQLVRKNGIFLITSCNFTQTEVTDRFTQLGFAIESIIPTPSFTFGGAKGSSTTTIAFRKL